MLEAIDAPKARKPELLNAFVEHWYKEVAEAAKSGREPQAVPFKTPYWHSFHRIDGAYFGFWCVEAVAAVKAFGLDDNLCLGHPSYPGDLLRPGAVTSANRPRIAFGLAGTTDAIPQPASEGLHQRLTHWEALKLTFKSKLGL